MPTFTLTFARKKETVVTEYAEVEIKAKTHEAAEQRAERTLERMKRHRGGKTESELKWEDVVDIESDDSGFLELDSVEEHGK